MIVEGYEIDEEQIYAWIRQNSVRSVLVEAPDGLKRIAVAVAGLLEDKGLTVFLLASHTWGGCDVGYREARELGVDGIIHIGHHGPVWFSPPSKPRVLFVPAFSTVDPTPLVLEAALEARREGARSLSVVTTVQHVKWLPEWKRALSELGLEVITGSYSGFEGLIVGCNYTSLRASDAVIVVAGGRFHALGAAIWSGRPTWEVDPYQRRVYKVETVAILSRRLFSLSRAMEARAFMVLVSTKPGQNRLDVAAKIKRALEEKKRKAVIVVFNDISREQVENFQGFDAYVNTACPRLAIDDESIFPGPALNPGEVKYILRGSLEGYSLRDALLLDLRDLRLSAP
ncbi:diphthamide biosynthesis enzyme Dph2 [Infirmifilum lucidum]|uniref:2-(3-amino-3-carboxypropyl)histidine synthase n=1 Tax=Infirmifilum lucidum TaxID=2776706 RepID=A0A7L9FIF5_9CREN|nr:diphthamide biosynthesis enzyme Dph2 [Infirmifilum lucidum]QOJ79487.1 diphthamide biosynthesis enzyme Dph2 [Infirmifilum lucidum]